MRKLFATLPLMALAIGVAFADPPKAPDKMTVKPGQLVRVTLATDAEIGLARNFPDDAAFFDELSLKKGQRRFAFQAPFDAAPGTQYVVAWWTKGETEGTTTTFTVAGIPPVPPVPPGPGPNPPVPPAPVVLGTFLIVVADEGAPSAAQSAVTEGATLEGLKAAGKARLYGNRSDAAKITLNKFDAAMNDFKIKPPCAFVMNDAGKATAGFQLPTTDSDFATVLKGVLK